MSPIETRLAAARQELHAVAVPDVSEAVIRCVAAGERGTRARRLRSPAVAFAALVLLAVMVLAVPSARRAVANLLGLPGLPIQVTPEQPESLAAGQPLRLGEAVTLAEARAGVAFPVPLPAELGAPDEVWLDADAVPGGQVTLLWRPRPGLPASAEHRVGALLTVLPGRLDSGLLAKSVWNPGTTLTSVQFGDGTAWWLGGAPHTLSYFDSRGLVRSDRSRLAGNTLLWQSGDALLRLESGLSMDAALRLARSVS